jgi:hypothetical protein
LGDRVGGGRRDDRLRLAAGVLGKTQAQEADEHSDQKAGLEANRGVEHGNSKVECSESITAGASVRSRYLYLI